MHKYLKFNFAVISKLVKNSEKEKFEFKKLIFFIKITIELKNFVKRQKIKKKNLTQNTKSYFNNT